MSNLEVNCHPWTPPGGVRFDARLASSHGIPYTPIPTSGAERTALDPGTERAFDSDVRVGRAGAPEGSYLRLDAQVSRSWALRLFGEEVVLVPYLKLINALDRRDALFYQFDGGEDLRPRSLEAVPVLPVIGIGWSR